MNPGTVIDVLFLLLTVSLALRGLFRGFSGEVLSLAGTLGGLYLAFSYAGDAGGLLAGAFGLSEGLAYGIGLVTIFVVVNLAAALLCRLVGVFLRVTRLSLVDRVFGLAAGIAKGFLLLLVFYGGTLLIAPFLPVDWDRGSHSLELAAEIWPKLEPFWGGSFDPGMPGVDVPLRLEVPLYDETS